MYIHCWYPWAPTFKLNSKIQNTLVFWQNRTSHPYNRRNNICYIKKHVSFTFSHFNTNATLHPTRTHDVRRYSKKFNLYTPWLEEKPFHVTCVSGCFLKISFKAWVHQFQNYKGNKMFPDRGSILQDTHTHTCTPGKKIVFPPRSIQSARPRQMNLSKVSLQTPNGNQTRWNMPAYERKPPNKIFVDRATLI